MISFIIIGKDIQNTIGICIESVFEFIKRNFIISYEVIYVDSNSIDNSIKIALTFPIKILQISGDVNAAIGRNSGARNAKGETLFFLDGDMELLPTFFDSVFNKNNQKLKYPFIRGFMKEKYYDESNNFLFDKKEKIGDKPVYEHITGGLMIIEKKLWERIGGMDERLIRNEDLDFGLRMSKIGIPVFKDNNYWIIHHTISYLEKDRFEYFYKTKALLSPGIFMRKHIYNGNYLRNFWRNVFYVSLLFASIILLFINAKYSLLLLLIYISIQLVRTMFASNKEKYFAKSFLFKSLFNIYTLLGFLFYYPQRPIYKTNTII
jgi:glycosyltransferase involved in cell wall biosynthesis